MRGIAMLGRRWLIATDDLFLIGMLDSFCYLPWVVWSSLKVYNWYFFSEKYFYGDSVMQSTALTSFCINMTIQWILAIGFLNFSTRGTMSQQDELRLPCVSLFRIKIIMVFLGPLWLLFFGHLVFTDDFSGVTNMRLWLMLATAFQALITAIQFPFLWAILDTESILKEGSRENEITQPTFLIPTPHSTVYRLKLRVNAALCSLATIHQNTTRSAMFSASDILVYVPHETRILFLDFVAGILLMRQKHKRQYLQEDQKISSQPAITSSDGSPVNHFPTDDMPVWMNLHLAKRYFHNRVTELSGITKLWNYFLCFLPFRNQKEGDEHCRSNSNGIQFKGSFPYKDFIRVSFRNKSYSIPFVTNVDTDSSAVVITIGGIMSADDVLTDAAAGLSSPMDAGCQQGIKCHGGMLKAAEKILEKLKKREILEAVMQGHTDFHLVTTGQNLGGSIAALLAIVLRPSHPSVRCFAFEPLPCLSVGDLETTSDCVFSIVFGYENIPFLSFHIVEHTIREIKQSAEGCNLPKYNLLLWPESADEDCGGSDVHRKKAGVTGLPRICIERDETEAKKSEEKATDEIKNEAKETISAEEHGKVKESVRNKKSLIETPPDDTTLFIPGRVLHIRMSQKGYRLQICTARDFGPPIIRPGMVIHHPPEYIEECLEQLGRTDTLLSASV